ncbi:MAG: DUF2325 domain-containing protein [Gammaproteobacteria bacterium]|jgi:hypothetical protein
MHSDQYCAETKDKKSDCSMRKKLWQLDSRFHCSLIGTCLSVRELRKLCRKIGISVQATLSDYELHRSFVEIGGQQTYSSRRLQKYLDQKYRAAIRHFAGAQDDTALERFWVAAVESGDIAPAYWALVTHPRVSSVLEDRAYGEVHMMSHLAGGTIRIDVRELVRLQHLTRRLRGKLAATESRAQAQIEEKDNRIRQLNDRSMQAQDAVRGLEAAREQLAALENDPFLRRQSKEIEEIGAKLKAEQARAEGAEFDAQAWKKRAVESGDRHLQLQAQLEELRAERDALEATLAKLVAPDRNASNERSTQEGFLNSINLLGRCILYVGGRSRQCAHFRALVERQNGQFLHHEGGLHGGRLQLGAMLPKADVVLCPLDCVSHDAANRIKQFCKRYGKKLVLLPRSSLAAFTRGLTELAA